MSLPLPRAALVALGGLAGCVEIVDSEEKIRGALPELDAMIEAAGNGGLVTLEKAEIIKYTHGNTVT